MLVAGSRAARLGEGGHGLADVTAQGFLDQGPYRSLVGVRAVHFGDGEIRPGLRHLPQRFFRRQGREAVQSLPEKVGGPGGIVLESTILAQAAQDLAVPERGPGQGAAGEGVPGRKAGLRCPEIEGVGIRNRQTQGCVQSRRGVYGAYTGRQFRQTALDGQQLFAVGIAQVIQVGQAGQLPAKFRGQVGIFHGREPSAHPVQHGERIVLAQQVLVHGTDVFSPQGGIFPATGLKVFEGVAGQAPGFGRISMTDEGLPFRTGRYPVGQDLFTHLGQGSFQRYQARPFQTALTQGVPDLGLGAPPAIGGHIGPGYLRILLVQEGEAGDPQFLAALQILACKLGHEHVAAQGCLQVGRIVGALFHINMDGAVFLRQRQQAPDPFDEFPHRLQPAITAPDAHVQAGKSYNPRRRAQQRAQVVDDRARRLIRTMEVCQVRQGDVMRQAYGHDLAWCAAFVGTETEPCLIDVDTPFPRGRQVRERMQRIFGDGGKLGLGLRPDFRQHDANEIGIVPSNGILECGGGLCALLGRDPSQCFVRMPAQVFQGPLHEPGTFGRDVPPVGDRVGVADTFSQQAGEHKAFLTEIVGLFDGCLQLLLPYGGMIYKKEQLFFHGGAVLPVGDGKTYIPEQFGGPFFHSCRPCPVGIGMGERKGDIHRLDIVQREIQGLGGRVSAPPGHFGTRGVRGRRQRGRYVRRVRIVACFHRRADRPGCGVKFRKGALQIAGGFYDTRGELCCIRSKKSGKGRVEGMCGKRHDRLRMMYTVIIFRIIDGI